jgi:hypothetical protein
VLEKRLRFRSLTRPLPEERQTRFDNCGIRVRVAFQTDERRLHTFEQLARPIVVTRIGCVLRQTRDEAEHVGILCAAHTLCERQGALVQHARVLIASLRLEMIRGRPQHARGLQRAIAIGGRMPADEPDAVRATPNHAASRTNGDRVKTRGISDEIDRDLSLSGDVATIFSLAAAVGCACLHRDSDVLLNDEDVYTLAGDERERVPVFIVTRQRSLDRCGRSEQRGWQRGCD